MHGDKAARPVRYPRPVSRVTGSGVGRGRATRAPRAGNYGAFWPYYLEAQGRPANRAFHYAGTAVSLAFLLAFLVVGDPWLLLGAVFGGYALVPTFIIPCAIRRRPEVPG